jgi:hypothetical protein
MQITIELTAEEAAAFELITTDTEFWCQNMVKERARAALGEYRQSTQWIPVALSLADPQADDWMILLHGIQTGVFKTAAQRNAEIEETV